MKDLLAAQAAAAEAAAAAPAAAGGGGLLRSKSQGANKGTAAGAAAPTAAAADERLASLVARWVGEGLWARWYGWVTARDCASQHNTDARADCPTKNTHITPSSKHMHHRTTARRLTEPGMLDKMELLADHLERMSVSTSGGAPAAAAAAAGGE